MRDERLVRMAAVLTRYSLGLRPGERVAILSTPLAEPLVELAYLEALRLGALPEVSLEPAGLRRIFLAEASPPQLADISPRERLLVESYDAVLRISAPANTRDLAGIPPERLASRSRATSVLQQTMLRRAASGAFKWTTTQYPTQASAQEADMSLPEYEEFVWEACLLNDPDPVASWWRLGATQERYVAYLNERDRFRVSSADVDLTFRAGGRRWINSDGRHNFPSGEVFTCPIEDSLEGTVRFTYPAIVMGKEIVGVRLSFRQGVVVEASAQKGEDQLRELLRTDEGSCRVGEVAFGTNPGIRRFTRNVLFDEKIRGTMHLALGAAYPETGGTNTSAIHVDLIADLTKESECVADGEVFYRNGEFLVSQGGDRWSPSKT